MQCVFVDVSECVGDYTKLMTMLKKCTLSTNAVTTSVISYDIMFIW